MKFLSRREKNSLPFSSFSSRRDTTTTQTHTHTRWSHWEKFNFFTNTHTFYFWFRILLMTLATFPGVIFTEIFQSTHKTATRVRLDDKSQLNSGDVLFRKSESEWVSMWENVDQLFFLSFWWPNFRKMITNVLTLRTLSVASHSRRSCHTPKTLEIFFTLYFFLWYSLIHWVELGAD